MREVRDGHEQFTAGDQHSRELAQGARLLGECEMLQDVQTQRAIERAVGIRQVNERRGPDKLGVVMRINALDRQSVSKFFDQDPFAAAGIEDMLAGLGLLLMRRRRTKGGAS